MKILFLHEYDIVNYKKANMFIGFPHCSFKCNDLAKKEVCQNYKLKKEKLIEISCKEIIDRYLNNPLTKAIVCGGLEPFDSPIELCLFIEEFRTVCDDDIVIYTGYNKQEWQSQLVLNNLKKYKNIIVKFGRYIPDDTSHYDEVLGVNLISSNQYAERIS